jgi:hypothetical protein
MAIFLGREELDLMPTTLFCFRDNNSKPREDRRRTGSGAAALR